MNDIVDFLPHDMSELLNFICVNILIVFTAVIFTGIYVGIKDIIKGWDRNMVKKETEVWNFLQDNGFTANAIDGIMMNLTHESSLNPRIIQGGAMADEPPAGLTGGYGLAQWTGARLESLKTYAKSKGTITGDFTTQIEFLVYEAKVSYPSVIEEINAADNPIDAANIWAKGYERTSHRYQA